MRDGRVRTTPAGNGASAARTLQMPARQPDT